VNRGWPFDQPARADRRPVYGGYGTMRYTIVARERSVSREARAGAEVFEKPSGDEDRCFGPPARTAPGATRRTGYRRFAPANAPLNRVEPRSVGARQAPRSCSRYTAGYTTTTAKLTVPDAKNVVARCGVSCVSPGVKQETILAVSDIFYSCRAECARVATLENESGTRR